MNQLVSTTIQYLPTLIGIVNKFTGASVPTHLVEDAAKLLEYAHNTAENLKQHAPLTPEQDAELDNLIEQLPQRDYWKSKDSVTSTTTNPPA